jgi:hypothetical protein
VRNGKSYTAKSSYAFKWYNISDVKSRMLGCVAYLVRIRVIQSETHTDFLVGKLVESCHMVDRERHERIILI